VSDGSSDDTDRSCLAVFKEVTEHLKTMPAKPHRHENKTEISKQWKIQSRAILKNSVNVRLQEVIEGIFPALVARMNLECG
jgi:hypothetical protein